MLSISCYTTVLRYKLKEQQAVKDHLIHVFPPHCYHDELSNIFNFVLFDLIYYSGKLVLLQTLNVSEKTSIPVFFGSKYIVNCSNFAVEHINRPWLSGGQYD